MKKLSICLLFIMCLFITGCGSVKEVSSLEDFGTVATDKGFVVYLQDYSNVNYRTSHDKIEIKCPKHGIFLQFPYDHLQGHGCPYCTNNYSIGEMEIYTYLCNKLGEDKIVLRDRTILNGKEIDIFIIFVIDFGYELTL